MCLDFDYFVRRGLYAEQHFLPSCSNYILVGERNKLRKKRNNVFYRIFRSFLIIFEPPPFSSSPLDWVCLCFFFFYPTFETSKKKKERKKCSKESRVVVRNFFTEITYGTNKRIRANKSCVSVKIFIKGEASVYFPDPMLRYFRRRREERKGIMDNS